MVPALSFSPGASVVLVPALSFSPGASVVLVPGLSLLGLLQNWRRVPACLLCGLIGV
jgi:hypothetical protein